MRYKVGDKIFDVKQAKTAASRKKGLSGLDKLPKDAGLLMTLQPQITSINMEGMKFPIDVVFINEGLVTSVKQLNVGDDPVSSDVEVDSILEVNAGAVTNILEGAEAGAIGSKNEDGTVTSPDELGDGITVLDEDGKVQAKLSGDERVFSRIHTNQLISAALKADKSEDDADYIKVGKAMVRMVHKQDTQKDQYSKN